MQTRQLKRWLTPLLQTPLHPQWLIGRALEAEDLVDLHGVVVDVGCADRQARTLLPEGTQYIGVDYYDTAVGWYGTRPDLFGDAHALPLGDATADNVLMLHVLEHLANPQQALGELARILRTGGRMLIEVPFAYPLHDSPLDFHRWTRHGLAEDLRTVGLEILDVRSIGRPTETAALLFNLSIARLCVDWAESRSPWLVMAPLILLLIPVANLMGWTLARLGGSQDFLPHRVRAWCRKPP